MPPHLFRGTYLSIYFLKVFVEHFNKINVLHRVGASFHPRGVSIFKKIGPSGHRPPSSRVKKFLYFKEVNKLFTKIGKLFKAIGFEGKEMALTEKMKAFARAKLKTGPDGRKISNRDAAIEAGYPEASAGSKGSQLMNNPEVLTYLDGLLKSGGAGAAAVFESMPLGEAAIHAELKEMESVEDALGFLRSVYKNPRIERKVRIEAAKAALPYESGKVGEKGIKQGREEAAGDVSENDDDFATARSQREARGQRMS